jgi:putative colanic acid biosynthesis UDP-glucose lipid carrier transferase
MGRYYSKYIKTLHLGGDLFLIALANLLGFLFLVGSFSAFWTSQYAGFMLYGFFTWIASTLILDSYTFYRVTPQTNVLVKVVKLVLLYILIMEATLNIADLHLPRPFLLSTYAFLFLSVSWWRIMLIYLIRLYRKSGYNFRRVVIAGYGESSRHLKSFFESHPEHGYRFHGFFDNKEKHRPHTIGKIEDLPRFVAEQDIDEIYCAPYELSKDQISNLITFAEQNVIRLKFLPEFKGFYHKNLKVDFYDMLPVLVVRPIPLDGSLNKVMKRAFDVVFSLMVITCLLSWLLPLLAILIKLDSRGPVFFRQRRSGLYNDSFWCWKLRTMYMNDIANEKQATRDDTRITRLGRLLRRTSLDEMPQFFNVLLGHMSIVGPRPHMLKHTEEYSRVIDTFMIRHLIKPGITGLSQIRGFRGETSESYMMRSRVKVDIFYLEKWTFFLDLKIIVLTVFYLFQTDKKAF